MIAFCTVPRTVSPGPFLKAGAIGEFLSEKLVPRSLMTRVGIYVLVATHPDVSTRRVHIHIPLSLLFRSTPHPHQILYSVVDSSLSSVALSLD